MYFFMLGDIFREAVSAIHFFRGYMEQKFLAEAACWEQLQIVGITIEGIQFF